MVLDNGAFARELIEPMELFMVLAHDSILSLFDHQVRPLHVSMEHARMHPASVYEEAFCCPVSFGAPSYALTFEPGVLDRPIEGAQEPIGHYVAKYLESIDVPTLKPPTQQDTAARVRRWIEAHLPDGPTHHQAAQAMGLSVRSLQRALAKQQTTFSEILSGARRAHAIHYVCQSRLSMAEVAFLLGYAEPSSFYRAFKAWTGTTPERMRQRG